MIIKAYIDISNHPFYESIILYPPDNVEFININKEDFLKAYDKLSIYYSFRRKVFKRSIEKIQYLTSVPRIKIVKKGLFDVYHSGRGVFVEGVDYVMDLEYIFSPYSLNGDIAKRKISKFILKKLFLRNNLKYIFPHSYATLYSIRDFLGQDFFNKIKEKTDVLYPAAEPKIDKHKKLNNDKIILLFISSGITSFLTKGGLEVLYAFLELRDRYPIELWVRSGVPNIIKEKYKDIVKFIPQVTRKELFDIYKKADIFVYPTYTDTWGYVLLESMSAGLPIITSDTFAAPEIVRNYENGLIVNVGEYKWNKGYLRNDNMKNIILYSRIKREIVEQLKIKISELIEDKKLYEKISKNNLLEVVKGRFSIEKRNKKLRDVYEICLKN